MGAPDPDRQGETEEAGPGRGRSLFGGFVKVLAVLGGILLALAALQIAAALLGAVVNPGPPGPGPATRINVQAGDLGSSWRTAADAALPGFPAGASSLRTFVRTGPYGGSVTISARVAVLPSAAAALSAYLENVSAVPRGASVSPAAVGDAGVLVDIKNASFLVPAAPHDVVLFRHGSVVVNLTVAVQGPWEDLSGQPFTAAWHLPDDLLVLARIVASRT